MGSQRAAAVSLASGTAKNWLLGCASAFTRADVELCALEAGQSIPVQALRASACKATSKQRDAHYSLEPYEPFYRHQRDRIAVIFQA